MVGEEQNNEGPAIGAGGSPLEPAGGTPASPPSEGVRPTPEPDAAPPVVEQTPTGGNGENREAGDESQATVSPLPLLPPVQDPPDRTAAAGHVERFLGHQGSLRDATIAELNDDEVREVLEAGKDRHTARQVIKDVLSRAYDRRRDAAATEARDRESALRRSSSALAVLQGPLGIAAEKSATILATLNADEQQMLAALVDDPDAYTIGNEVLGGAERRRAAEAAKPSP